MIHIEEHEASDPYLLSIGEQVERVIQQLKDRQISVEAALARLQESTQQIVAAQEERQQHSELDNRAFALFLALKGLGVQSPQATAVKVSEALATHPGWAYSQHQERAVRQGLVKILRPVVADGSSKSVAAAVNDLLRMAGMLGS